MSFIASFLYSVLFWLAKFVAAVLIAAAVVLLAYGWIRWRVAKLDREGRK